jgi:anti-sigma28 factor (negative regulator of flagellin synthesis)
MTVTLRTAPERAPRRIDLTGEPDRFTAERSARVAALRRAIGADTYEIAAEDVADAIVTSIVGGRA